MMMGQIAILFYSFTFIQLESNLHLCNRKKKKLVQLYAKKENQELSSPLAWDPGTRDNKREGEGGIYNNIIYIIYI